MKIEKSYTRLLHDADGVYLKRTPAYKLYEIRDYAGDLCSEQILIYGDDVEGLSNDGHYREPSHIVRIIQNELRLRKKQLNSEKRILDDIAIQYIWEDKKIIYQNKDQIAELFPELKLKNGSKLYQRFNFYSLYPINRLNDQGGYNENKKHLKILTKALNFLSEPEHIKQAESEILTFKQNVKKISNQSL